VVAVDWEAAAQRDPMAPVHKAEPTIQERMEPVAVAATAAGPAAALSFRTMAAMEVPIMQIQEAARAVSVIM
jgi:hypothetical protein